MTIHITMPVSFRVPSEMSLNIFQENFPLMIIKTKLPAHPTAAPSVGVAIPEKIEPKTDK